MWCNETPAGNTAYRERYTDPISGKSKIATVTLKGADNPRKRKIAQEDLSKLIAEKISGASAKDLTLKELKARYIKFQSSTCKESTVRRNDIVLSRVVEALGADSKIENLTSGYIRDRLLAMTENPATLNERLVRFKAMIRWAYESDYIQSTAVVDKIKKFKDDRVNKTEKYLEPEQLSAMLDYMKTSQEAWYLLAKFLVLSGLRIGEAAALEKSDIHDGVISVNKTLDHVTLKATAPKTPASNREVFIQPELEECISEIKAYYRNRDILSGTRTKHLFSQPDGSYIKYPCFEVYMKEVTEKVLGERRTPHSLRHTHASLLMVEGMSVDAIQRRLGHENSKVTREIYLHVMKKIKEQDNAALSKIKLIS